jgi:ribose transport system permease protein
MRTLLHHRRDVLRPFVLLAILAVLYALLPVLDSGATVGIVDVNNILTMLASLGLVSLALGLTMIAGEFDLSVSSTYLLGSMLAVTTGAHSPLFGIAVAVAVGVAIGLLQGLVISKFGINSMAVTLGGFIGVLGLVYVISKNQSIAYQNQSVGVDLTRTIASVFSLQIFIGFAIFGVLAIVLMATSFGRDLRALGSDRKASTVVGLRIPLIISVTFALSAGLCSFSGALQGYSLAYAAPTQTVSPVIFAATAVLLGGVPLSGGRGNPIMIAAGVLSLGIMTEALPDVHAASYVNSLLPAALLMIVALVDAPDVLRWWRVQRARHSTVTGLKGAPQTPRGGLTATDEISGG